MQVGETSKSISLMRRISRFPFFVLDDHIKCPNRKYATLFRTVTLLTPSSKSSPSLSPFPVMDYSSGHLDSP